MQYMVRKNLRCSLSYPSDFSFLSYSSKLTTADRTIIVCSHQYCFCGNYTAAEKVLRSFPKAFVFCLPQGTMQPRSADYIQQCIEVLILLRAAVTPGIDIAVRCC
jgi:hypothetical protein